MEKRFLLKYLLITILSLSSLWSQTALEYLNDKRIKAGMIPFSENNYLNTSALNHANYMMQNMDIGHDENSTKSGYTGDRPWDRAHSAGYNGLASENLTAGFYSNEESIDGLFSAIYHRFGFLSFVDNEVGIGMATNDDKSVESRVYNMGNSNIVDLCNGESFASNGYYYDGVCIDQSFKIEDVYFEGGYKSVARSNPEIVVWPYENQSDSDPVFYEESPDPLPTCSVSGYPVSIQFNNEKNNDIYLNSFKLFDMFDNEITDVKLMTESTDHNGHFSKNDFALFPMKRLDWNSNYTAKFTYTENGNSKEKTWSFKTKSLNHAYYVADLPTQTFNVISGKTYSIYVPPVDCNDSRTNFSYSYTTSSAPDIDWVDPNTANFTITGNEGETVVATLNNGREITLNISNEDSARLPNTNFEVLKNQRYTIASDEIKYLNLNMTTAGKVDLVVKNIEFQIYDDHMNSITGGTYDRTMELESGTYIVKLSNSNNYSSSYYIDFFSPILNEPNSITTLEEKQYEILTSSTQYYDLNMTVDGKFDINIYDTMMDITVFDSNMTVVDGKSSFSRIIDLTAGEYIVKLASANGNSTASFLLLIPSVLDTVPTLINQRYEYPEDTISYFKLSMPEDGNLDIDTGGRLYVTIFDENMNIVDDTSYSDRTVFFSSGDYFLKVSAFKGSYGNNYVDFYSPVLDDEKNFPFLENKIYNFTEKINQYFYLNMRETGNIDIDRISAGSGYASVTIYDEEMNVIQSQLTSAKTLSLAKGKYIVKLVAWGDYKMSFYSHIIDSQNNFPQLENKTYTLSGGSLEFYNFELSSTSYLDIISESVEVSIYDENMNLIHKNAKGIKQLASGSYLIKLLNGSYTRSVSFYTPAINTQTEFLNIENNKEYILKSEKHQYFNLSMAWASDIQVNIDYYGDMQVMIYDQNMNLLHSISEKPQTISLAQGDYIIKAFNTDGYNDEKYSFFSLPLSEQLVNKKTYITKEDTQIEYLKLYMPSSGQLEIDTESRAYVTIMDTNENLVNSESDSDRIVLLHEGDYLIKTRCWLSCNDRITFFTPVLDAASSLPSLESKSYTLNGDDIDFYKLDMSTTSEMSFTLGYEGRYIDVFIYDEQLNVLHKIQDTSTITLESGRYIVKIKNRSRVDIQTLTITNTAIDTDYDGEPNESDLDDDNDGMGDEYELANGLNPLLDDSLLDLDNDGVSNYQEYLDGTNPNDETSKIFTLTLNSGWNLIALPLNSSISIDGLNNQDLEVVRSFQNNQWNVWTKNSTSTSEQPLATLEDGYGYWIKTTDNTTIIALGEGVADGISIQDNKWNMLGSVIIENFNTYFVNNPNVKVIWKYSNSQWYAISNDSDITNDLNTQNIPLLDSIDINEGFIVK